MEELDKKIAEWLGLDRVPHFSRSIGLCFKYIVPKIKDPEIAFYQFDDKSWEVSISYKSIYLKGTGEEPALALCRAAEKLIDGY